VLAIDDTNQSLIFIPCDLFNQGDANYLLALRKLKRDPYKSAGEITWEWHKDGQWEQVKPDLKPNIQMLYQHCLNTKMFPQENKFWDPEHEKFHIVWIDKLVKS